MRVKNLNPLFGNMLYTRLFTIHERNNNLRHFGTKIGNCWWFNGCEILYLIENGHLKSHPVLNERFFRKMIQNDRFQIEYSLYRYLKGKQFNFLDGKLYYHIKEFNRRNIQSNFSPVLAQMDDEVRLLDHIAVISLFNERYSLKITRTWLNHEISGKMNKKNV